jgi:hypothetical protein
MTTMNHYHHLLLIFLIALTVLLPGCISPPEEIASTTGETDAALSSLVAEVNTGLTQVQTSLQNNAAFITGHGMTGPETEAVMNELLLTYPWGRSSVTVSVDGEIQNAVPEQYQSIIGENLGEQTIVRNAFTFQAPYVSDLCPLSEGYSGVVQSVPVFSKSGEYLGYTDITYQPYDFLNRYISPFIEETGSDIWVTQTDGTILFDTTKEEIGKNLFTDPAYQTPELQAVFEHITTEPSGTGEYQFWDKNWEQHVTKEARWETAGIDGATWRIVMTQVINETKTAPAPTSNTPAGTHADELNEVKSFVKRAATFAQETDRETALATFNDLNGPFIDGELYIFAYDINGTVIALPHQPGLIGEDRSAITDANGVAFIKGLTTVAKSGGGTIYYVYPNPARGYAEELKLSYVLPVDDSWFVGAGVYSQKIAATYNATEIDALITRVRTAREYARTNGKDAALTAFNDLGEEFAKGGDYIFAYTTNGTTLALPYQQNYLGIDRYNFTDTYGVKIIVLESAAAQDGGGFVYVHYLNPDTGTEGMKLCYVTPVDDKWFVGSGIYAK